MTKVFNRSDLLRRRHALRRNSTLPEDKLWVKLRNRQLNGYKFRRQYSIEGFVVDFYCASHKLAIEVDGDGHYRKKVRVYDLQRERVIKFYGINVIRFTNFEVIQNLEEVLESINSLLNKIPHPDLLLERRGDLKER